jgi:hypothetical protein
MWTCSHHKVTAKPRILVQGTVGSVTIGQGQCDPA